MIFGPWKLILKIVSTMVSLVLFYFAFTLAQIYLTSHEHSTQSADAILVFGTTEDNGVPSPTLAARLAQAVTLWDEHRAQWVVVTGGNRPGDVYTEAGVSKTYLAAHGVPSARILEGAGSDTWQNVATAAATMEMHNIHTVLVVTDPFHEYRAMAISSAQGFSPQPAPDSDPAIGGFSLLQYYLKEMVSVGVGRLVGYGTLSSWTTTAVTASSLVTSVGG